MGSLAGSQCCGAAFLKSFVWTHGRNWLTRSDFVFQKTVNIERPQCIQAIDHAQRVEWHSVVVQHFCGRQHLVERCLAVLGNAILVMQLFRPVNTESDQKSMLFQESAPLIIQQCAVRL